MVTERIEFTGKSEDITAALTKVPESLKKKTVRSAQCLIKGNSLRTGSPVIIFTSLPWTEGSRQGSLAALQ